MAKVRMGSVVDMAGLTSAEETTLEWVTCLAGAGQSNAKRNPDADAWRYSSVGDLLLDHGRFFTPGPALEDLSPMGAGYANANRRANSCSEVYVEGLACPAFLEILPLEHAWCAAGNTAVDPTWPDGVSYFGIPFTDDYRQHRRQTTGEDSLLWSPAVLELLQHGLPDGAVAEVGRPIPPRLRRGGAAKHWGVHPKPTRNGRRIS